MGMMPGNASQPMSTTAATSGIRDNHRRGVVADFLKAKIHPGSQRSAGSASFTRGGCDA